MTSFFFLFILERRKEEDERRKICIIGSKLSPFDFATAAELLTNLQKPYIPRTKGG